VASNLTSIKALFNTRVAKRRADNEEPPISPRRKKRVKKTDLPAVPLTFAQAAAETLGLEPPSFELVFINGQDQHSEEKCEDLRLAAEESFLAEQPVIISEEDRPLSLFDHAMRNSYEDVHVDIRLQIRNAGSTEPRELPTIDSIHEDVLAGLEIHDRHHPNPL
jgi:hypothetical protein